MKGPLVGKVSSLLLTSNAIIRMEMSYISICLYLILKSIHSNYSKKIIAMISFYSNLKRLLLNNCKVQIIEVLHKIISNLKSINWLLKNLKKLRIYNLWFEKILRGVVYYDTEIIYLYSTNINDQNEVDNDFFWLWREWANKIL